MEELVGDDRVGLRRPMCVKRRVSAEHDDFADSAILHCCQPQTAQTDKHPVAHLGLHPPILLAPRLRAQSGNWSLNCDCDCDYYDDDDYY